MNTAKLMDRMSIAPVHPGHCEWCGVPNGRRKPRPDCGHTTCERCDSLTDRGAYCPVCAITKVPSPSAPKWRQLTFRFALYWQEVDWSSVAGVLIIMGLFLFVWFVLHGTATHTPESVV